MRGLHRRRRGEGGGVDTTVTHGHLLHSALQKVLEAVVVKNKEARQVYMRRRAFELAESGDHIDYLTIEAALINEGYPEARTYLDRNSLRDDLKAACDRARRAAKNA